MSGSRIKDTFTGIVGDEVLGSSRTLTKREREKIKSEEADFEFTLDNLDSIEFSETKAGYTKSEVDKFIDSVRDLVSERDSLLEEIYGYLDELDDKDREIKSLKNKLEILSTLPNQIHQQSQEIAALKAENEFLMMSQTPTPKETKKVKNVDINKLIKEEEAFMKKLPSLESMTKNKK